MPCNTDDYLGIIAQSVKYGLLITYSIIYVIILYVIINSVKFGTVSVSDTLIFALFMVTIMFTVIFWLSWAGATALFQEQVEIKNNAKIRIVHKFLGKQKTINADKFAHILWEKQKLPIYGRRHGVYLIGIDADRYKLISNHFAFTDNLKFKDFVEKLSNALSIPIKEESYISEGEKIYSLTKNYPEAITLDKAHKRFRNIFIFIVTLVCLSSFIAAHSKTPKYYVYIGIITTIIGTFLYSMGNYGIDEIVKGFRVNYLYNILIIIPIASLYTVSLFLFWLILK